MTSQSQTLRPSTFSIVAFDFENGDLGAAVQSKFPAVGAVVPWARAGVGAIATQLRATLRVEPNGLKILERNLSAQDTLRKLLADDTSPQVRQFVDFDM